MFTSYKLLIGLNDKDSKRQEISTIDAYKTIQNIVGDCTIQESTGIYTHIDGTQVLEKTLQVQVIDFKGDMDIEPIVHILKKALNQEAIVVVTERIDSKMI